MAKNRTVVEYMPSYGGTYYLATTALLEGRGVKMADDGRNHIRGLKTYHVTETAWKKIKAKYTTERSKSF